MSGPGSDSPGLRSAARSVAAVAARRAAAADTDRILHREVVDALLDAGFARHFVPVDHGGHAGGCAELLQAVALVGEGCTSAAWCASVLAGASRMGAYLPEAGQRELWSKGQDTKVVGALMPGGRATPEPGGGWRLSGEWDFTSAVDFSDWALVCALVPAGGHREPWFFAVPRQEYRVADTWFNVGMRGTGSNTLLIDAARIPEHRGFARREMLAGRSVGSRARCHRAPLRLLSGLLFAAPALGAARAALNAWAARPAGRDPAEGGSRVQPTAARAASRIDAAGLLLERAARVADAERQTPPEALRNPADCALAVEQLVEVVEELFRSVGSRGQLETHRLQRIWRDVHCLASHVALRHDTAASPYGGHLLESAQSPHP
ncbi:acyl-CoA dehydrogenase family protein [Streptomyces sp. TP-A0874]|uniref:acyl-CoA dehydrogenase family protein n=1 Tax=Streptomyces sp. TP-A0874 TaxID=549819 RepID=UPI0008529EEC|nr:acyl-CoA dehydrogenase family protein [Streptomyces sp. TP-A0874]